MTLRAVMSGDIVASTRLGPERTERAIAALRDAARELSHFAGEDTRFTRFRGDGWQIYLPDPLLGLDAVLLLNARLRMSGTGAETRIAIGFGTVERMGGDSLAGAFGEAFMLAGEALDAMPRHRRIDLAHAFVVLDWHRALFELATWIAGRWTPEQAEAVALAMRKDAGLTQAEIAESLGISRQAVQRRLSGAGWDALSAALAAVRRHDWAERAT